MRGGGLSLVLLLARMEWNTPQGPRAPLPEFGEGLQAGTVGNVGGAKLTPAYLGAPPPGAPPLRVARSGAPTAGVVPATQPRDSSLVLRTLWPAMEATSPSSAGVMHQNILTLPAVTPPVTAPHAWAPLPLRSSSTNRLVPVDHAQGESPGESS